MNPDEVLDLWDQLPEPRRIFKCGKGYAVVYGEEANERHLQTGNTIAEAIYASWQQWQKEKK